MQMAHTIRTEKRDTYVSYTD